VARNAGSAAAYARRLGDPVPGGRLHDSSIRRADRWRRPRPPFASSICEGLTATDSGDVKVLGMRWNAHARELR
jgi:hypothetical protein